MLMQKYIGQFKLSDICPNTVVVNESGITHYISIWHRKLIFKMRNEHIPISISKITEGTPTIAGGWGNDKKSDSQNDE